MPETPAHTLSLSAHWLSGQTILNLRGQADDPPFLQACRAAFGLRLPGEPLRTVEHGPWRVVWVGPDDWFLIGPPGQAQASMDALRQATAGLHAAVTDVSSGYTVLRLAGAPVRDVLAEGCPLDLHPRAFGPGSCAGSHFFKASVWLWRAQAGPDAFELLVRRSFMGYLDLMLQRSAREYELLRPGA